MDASRMLPCCWTFARLLERWLLLLLLLLLQVLLLLLPSTRWQCCQSAVRTRARPPLRRGCIWKAKSSADCSMAARLTEQLPEVHGEGEVTGWDVNKAQYSPGCDATNGTL
jgi:hypothetical protein